MKSKEGDAFYLLLIGLLSWIVPGGGYYLIKEKKRAVIVFVTVLVTFGVGIYIGSYGVVNPVHAKPWYLAQLMAGPWAAILGHFSTAGNLLIYGRANDYGQIYTGIAGLLNLLAVVNAVYLGHVKAEEEK
jgi:hypothetical protein